jgi:diguanylate cyclase (GGDEF)-like protein
VTLDIATLFAVTVFMTGLGGLLLLCAWLQARETKALAWWGATFIVFAPATALFGSRGLVADVWSMQTGPSLMMLGYGMLWTGGRVFEGHKPLPLWAAAGAILWFAVCRFDPFVGSLPARATLGSLIVAIYSALFIRELWRGRGDRLVSRWPVMALVALHAVLFPLRAFSLDSVPFPLGAPVTGTEVGSLLIFAPLLYAFALVFLLMALTKERAEARQRHAATIDSLTGIPNRRGFTERAGRLLGRSRRDQTPLTMLLFDLDRFKNVNDRFGHRMGDAVLSAFANSAAQSLRPLDLLGRIGGEEFVALLPGVDTNTAVEVAERVRDSFSIAAREVCGLPVAATVSVGTASAALSGYDFDALYASADAALYRAKQQGRNRIETGRPMPPPAAPRRIATKAVAAT